MNSFTAISQALKFGSLVSHEDASHFEVGNVFIKVMALKKGDQVVTHAHAYNHAHILGKGRIEIEVNGRKTEYVAPAVIEILAGEHHGITALEDSTGFCVHDTSRIEAVPFRG